MSDHTPERAIKRRMPRILVEKKKQQAQRAHYDQAVVTVWAATRRDCDLSQEALAQKLGWSRDMVAAVEGGRRKITVSDLLLFASALGLEPETIFRRILRW